ncbi:MAG: transglutaminase domain-containing protein [Thermodesulfobacteriota bacterium]
MGKKKPFRLLFPIFAFLALLLAFGANAAAENILLNGAQKTRMAYRMVQEVRPKPDTGKLYLSYVVPESFSSATNEQKITDLAITFSRNPDKKEESTDQRGNRVLTAYFTGLKQPVTANISFVAENTVKLAPLSSRAPFPLAKVPANIEAYLAATEQADAKDPAIAAKAREITRSATTEFDAVQRVLSYVVDNMRYELIPASYNAVWSFKSGRGNCQNYSHLAAAMLRSVGVPVRVINGVTLDEPYDINMKNAVLTMKMAKGRHSWIEVWFPDLGWTPFDPQNTQMYVSSRFIRVEAGLDNNETSKDGLIRWTQPPSRDGRPEFKEEISDSFLADDAGLSGERASYGPTNLLLTPRVSAAFEKVEAPAPPPPPVPVQADRLKLMRFTQPYVFGNLAFPEGVDFFNSRGPTRDEGKTFAMRKNFLVETAEYVTTQGRQYAQAFILDKPMLLSSVGLALHSFGGEGEMWAEIFSDENGMPGKPVAASDLLECASLPFRPGYFWVDFSFKKAEVRLSPGTYWIGLGFTGSPIVNWFYSYGRPVGPENGTRYKTIFDPTWSRSMAFTFNYRVSGLTPEG